MRLRFPAPKRIALIAVAITVLEIAAHADAPTAPTAEDLYAEGQAAYDKADYATAITKWQASYVLSGEIGLLFNLAQAKRLSSDCTGALATYHRFTAADTDSTSEQHKLANDFARELEGTCGNPKPLAIPPKAVETDPQTDHARPSRTWKVAGLVTGSAGVVALAVGLGVGSRGASIGNEITAACATSCDWGALKDKDARGRRDVAIGRKLDVAGIAAIAGGAIFYYLGLREKTITLAPTPRDGGGVLSWSGSW